MGNNKKILPVYIRNLVFGVEDGLVSTVGFLAGIVAGGVDKSYLILSGIVLIFVEAFSMGVGSFLSESSTEESDLDNGRETGKSIRGGFIMFVSYLFAGFLVLLPYFFSEGTKGMVISIALSFVALFILGFISAKLVNASVFKRVARMIIIGGLAIAIGVAVGIFVR